MFGNMIAPSADAIGRETGVCEVASGMNNTPHCVMFLDANPQAYPCIQAFFSFHAGIYNKPFPQIERRCNMSETAWKVVPEDVEILRKLGVRKREIAESPINQERRRLWYKHDRFEGERPMVLVEGGVAFELLPCSELRCREEWARQVERSLAYEIFRFEFLKDDHVVLPYIDWNWKVHMSDFGVQSVQHYAERVSGNVSSRRWDPPLQDLEKDFDKLHFRHISVDREGSLAWRDLLTQVFDGILTVRQRGGFWWTTGMTQTAIDLVGLEQFMTYMCINPDGVHRLMAFLRDDLLHITEWLEQEGLYALNNENDYIGSGSMGFTEDLPQKDWTPGNPVRRKDLWVLSESQETSEVGPEMFEEFVFRYQLPIVQQFGLCYYGCCEPLHLKWNIIRRFPNLRRVSISPWCDQAYMAEAMGNHYVFSRKPNPAYVSTPDFDEEVIRKDIAATLDIARNNTVELILKDVHTICNEPRRLARWVEIAYEEIEKRCG